MPPCYGPGHQEAKLVGGRCSHCGKGADTYQGWTMAEVHVSVSDDMIAKAVKWLEFQGKKVNRSNVSAVLRDWATKGIKAAMLLADQKMSDKVD